MDLVLMRSAAAEPDIGGVAIELRETEVIELIRRKLLDAGSREDLRAIRNAMQWHLDKTLGARGEA
jgi:hypothetical protein